MGYGSRRLLVSAMLDEHGGEKEKEHDRLWKVFENAVKALARQEAFASLDLMVYGSEDDSEENPEKPSKEPCGRCGASTHGLELVKGRGIFYYCYLCNGISSGSWVFAGAACSAAIAHVKSHVLDRSEPSRAVGTGE